MLMEARALGLDSVDLENVRRLSTITSEIVRSGFARGIGDLEDFRRSVSGADWVNQIDGEYSGGMLRMPDNDLRRLGRAVFDNLELSWDHNAISVLEEFGAPLLWVLAEQDREAPIERSLLALKRLQAKDKLVDVYLFPDTDHGMYEYIENDDGTRKPTRVTDGYFRLVGDWIRQHDEQDYGRAEHVIESTPISGGRP